MVALRELLAAPDLQDQISVVSGAIGDQLVEDLTILENIAQIRTAAPNSLVLLTETAARQVEPYRLDMALRLGATRPVPAITFVGVPAPLLSRTGRELSSRGGPVVLAAASSSLTLLALPLAREIHGGAGSALQRLFDLLRAMRRMTAEPATPDALVQMAETLVDRPFYIDKEQTTGSFVTPVVVDGRTELTLSSPRAADPSSDRQTELALQLLADALARVLAAHRRAEHIPITSRSELLTEFLSVDEAHAEPILRRARAAGIPIDGWHVGIGLEVENLITLVDHDEVAAYELREEIIRKVHNSLRSIPGDWHRARSGLASLFLHTTRHDPGLLAARALARPLELALTQVLTRQPRLQLRCGVGSVHSGPHGLRASSLEAVAGIAEARLRNIANHPVLFDPASLRRGLIEWYASDSARESARRLLAPLERLSAQNREKLIRTLMAYLDAGGSTAKASKTLYLHRNAVAYRLKQALKLLDVDLDDPDQRLMLHLACRAELLRSTGVPR